jgi:flagellar hook-associated protein 1 FlgK
MSISTFFGLQTALSGILAQQRGLDVTAHNVSNANTLGYSRQEAVMVASPAFTYPSINTGGVPGQIGTGVDVTSYRRVRDAFVDVQLRAQTTRKGNYEAKSDGLDQVELALAEPGDTGLSSLLNRFWNAWQDVANAPENLATRQALVQAAGSLADGFRSLSSQLSTIRSQTAANVVSTLDEVNQIGQQVLALNVQIANLTGVGDAPNDLLDQRDVLLDRLAQLGNVSVTGGPLNTIDITFGGAAFVTGTTSAATLAESDLTSLSSGKLAGLVNLRDVLLPGYTAQLDAIAAAVVTKTNALHHTGYDLNGIAGGDFFAASGTTAATIAVDAALAASPARVAAAKAPGEYGDATVALQIKDIRDDAAADVAYRQLVTKIGADSQEAQRSLANATLLADSLENRRDSISGVSLDEEMTNLMRFQRGFQASSRALSAMDEMIELLVMRTGKVGL